MHIYNYVTKREIVLEFVEFRLSTEYLQRGIYSAIIIAQVKGDDKLGFASK